MTIPILRKIPIYSIRYYLDIHTRYAFNKIRESKHESADNIISLLYEIIFLQQKISTSLLDFLKESSDVHEKKGDSIFLGAEVNSIIRADSIFVYLKASMEKNIVLLGYILNIRGLENKKTQKARIAQLSEKIKEKKHTNYTELLLELTSSEAIGDINKYRTGILHKKGIADLQPHNYVGIPAKQLPHLKLYDVMYHQHRKGTLCLISTLAVLTDILVKLSPEDESIFMEKYHIFQENI